MVKTFCENVNAIQVQLVDRNGNKKTKTAKLLSVKECREISKKYEKVKNDDTGEVYFEVLQEQMVCMYGGKIEDYENYTPALLKNVIKYTTEQIINPTVNQIQTKEEKDKD